MLTPKQVEALLDASANEISPWNYGSSTVATLKRLAFIEPVRQRGGMTLYRATDLGRRALAELEGK